MERGQWIGWGGGVDSTMEGGGKIRWPGGVRAHGRTERERLWENSGGNERERRGSGRIVRTQVWRADNMHL